MSCHSCVAADIGESDLDASSRTRPLSNDISNEIRSALVFVTTRYSEVFVTSLSNRYYSSTSNFCTVLKLL